MTNILVIKLGALGDVLRTTCILSGLHEKYRGTVVSWVTAENAVCLLLENPLIDQVFSIEQVSADELSKVSYDLVISLDDEPVACEFANALNAKTIFGAYRRAGQTFYTPDSADWFDMSLISSFGKKEADDRKRSNLRSYPEILFDSLAIKPGRPYLHLKEEDQNFAENFAETTLTPDSFKIGLNTGAGSRWQFKQLSVTQTVQLANQLSDRPNREILIYGGPEETDRNREIIRNANNPIVDTGTNNTIKQFASLISLCDILITSDSLAMHIAFALGIDTVSFFGPTSSAEIEQFARGYKIISPISCVCCYKTRCSFMPNCMDSMPMNQIVQSVEKLSSLRDINPTDLSLILNR